MATETRSIRPRCARCTQHACYEGTDCFGVSDRQRYDEDAVVKATHHGATAIEARHYCQLPRLAEIIRFAQELGYRHLGLAYCIGLAEEAAVTERILSQHVEVSSVCCKVGGIKKTDVGLERIREECPDEVMCNPLGQAYILNEAGTDLNVICGLCVGHDALFSQASTAPVTTLIAKDRVLAHNPAGALYCRYLRRELEA